MMDGELVAPRHGDAVLDEGDACEDVVQIISVHRILAERREARLEEAEPPHCDPIPSVTAVEWRVYSDSTPLSNPFIAEAVSMDCGVVR